MKILPLEVCGVVVKVPLRVSKGGVTIVKRFFMLMYDIIESGGSWAPHSFSWLAPITLTLLL